jgi:hypothetical protein
MRSIGYDGGADFMPDLEISSLVARYSPTQPATISTRCKRQRRSRHGHRMEQFTAPGQQRDGGEKAL